AEGVPELKKPTDLARPRVRGIYNGVYFRNNSAGFRGPEYDVQKPRGVFRIIIAGDSVTMGSGVREEEAYPHLLEDALNARGGEHHYEVLNLGFIGINVHEVMSRLQVKGVPFHPDLIIYGCTLNDIKGPAYRKSMGSSALLMQQARYNRFRESPSYLLRSLWPRWQSLLDLVRPRPGSYVFELRDNCL